MVISEPWDFTADHSILGQEEDRPLEAWRNLDTQAGEGGMSSGRETPRH